MAFKMLTMAIILLAYFTASDSARIRQSKTDRVFDATDAHASEDGAVSAAVGAEAEAAGPPAFNGKVRKQLGVVLNDPPIDLSKTFASVKTEEGRRVVGHVKSWMDGWGFLTSNEVQGDILVHTRENPELGGSLCVGEKVIFDLASGTNGRPRAKNAARPKGRGLRVTGILATYGDGCGLIKSPSLREKLYCGESDNPAIKEHGISTGDEVHFEVATNITTGKSKAVNVRLLVKDQSELVGRRLIGLVKSWRGDWGFASSSKFTGWIMLGRKELQASGLPWLNVGEPLEFEISKVKDGRYEAIKISSIVPAASLAPPAASGAGRMTGRVKTFYDHWGFIQSDQHPGDIYVSAGAAHGQLKIGEMVTFDLKTKPGNHNGARAANVMRLSGGAGRAHAPPLMPMRPYVPQATPPQFYSKGYATAPGQTLWGTMVSVQESWGWVKIAGIQGDVFLGMRDNPHLSALPAMGSELSFELTLDPKSGRYKAVSVAPSLKGTRVQGIVTKVRDGGWGFATSKGVEGDVMIGNRNLNDSGIETIHKGDVLEYELDVGAKGYKALNIRVVSAH